MRIIPVMDLKGGQVVHGVGGRREQYRPIQSTLVDSSRPEDIAKAFRDVCGFEELYLADLDAIAGAAPSWKVYRSLSALGLRLLVDAGIRGAPAARDLQAAGVQGVVVGLETVDGPGELDRIVAAIGCQATWFSLDLKNGEPIGRVGTWPEGTATAIADEVVASGIHRIIVLDLARVGEQRGTGTTDLCRELRSKHSNVELFVGGGVSDESDVQSLSAMGVAGALVATALHQGRLRGRNTDHRVAF